MTRFSVSMFGSACDSRPVRRCTVPAALFLALTAAAPVFAGGTNEKSSYTVATAHSEALGTYLTDGRGNTLYYYTDDIPGLSNCTSGCEAVWPPFTVESISVPPSLQASDFGYITRQNGRKQVTYKGWPLYYYSRDWAPHDTNGQALYGTWYVVQPALFGPPGT